MQKSEVRHYECPICGDTTASTLSHPVGSLVSIVNNYGDVYILEKSLLLNTAREGAGGLGCNDNVKELYAFVLNSNSENISWGRKRRGKGTVQKRSSR